MTDTLHPYISMCGAIFLFIYRAILSATAPEMSYDFFPLAHPQGCRISETDAEAMYVNTMMFDLYLVSFL